MSFLAGRDLTKCYIQRRGRRREQICAVNAVDLALPEDKSLGLVGESGCGKSTLLRLLLRLEEPTTGKLYFQGRLLNRLPEKELTYFRQEVQAVFQDAAASLNPRISIEKVVAEPLLNFKTNLSQRERKEMVREVLDQVGLVKGDEARYPHEFSGGQLRRIALARALVSRPRLILCDEATSGLDVSVQARLLNLLLDLRQEYRVNYLFVTHDLAAVRYLCSHIAVMYAGRLVEELPAAFLKHALHPYTRALLEAEPDLWGSQADPPLSGEPPDPASFPPGCRFHPRCAVKLERCSRESPHMEQVCPEHRVACWRSEI